MNIRIEKNKDLKPFNSWHVGGAAEFFCQPTNVQELSQSLKWANTQSCGVCFLGDGTNVLISDTGVKGLVIHLKKLSGLKFFQEKGRLCLKALSGTPKAKVMQVFVRHRLEPALFLCGLPGLVGGGVVMNAGLGGSGGSDKSLSCREFKDIVDGLGVMHLDGQQEWIKKGQVHWEYRHTKGWGTGVIFEVKMSWPLQPLPGFSDRLKAVALKRSQTQPLKSLSCGSVFKNPPQSQWGAGALIEKAGLKGASQGPACVSEKHANFIVNTAQAQARDIHQLIKQVQKKVQDRFGVFLQPEVRYLGQW